MTEDFHGLQTQTLENKFIRLDYLVEAGPRIVRLFCAGSPVNLLADVFNFRIPTPQGEYSFLGGHRLWRAPESFTETYIPDLKGLQVQSVPQGVRLSMKADASTGIAKSLELYLGQDMPSVTLVHELRNESPASVEMSAWGITQLSLGGIALLPLPDGATDPNSLLPNRQITFWPYASLQDARLSLQDEAIVVKGQGGIPPVKVGCKSTAGWLAYQLQGILFIKRFTPVPDARHPDLDCNTEIYCNDNFIELETLSPLVHVEPGQSIRHTEIWELYPGINQTFLTPTQKTLLYSGK